MYIEYFHIEIFAYFHINESSHCAFWRKKAFLKHFYISCGVFCFLRIIITWSEVACQIKGSPKAEIFFFTVSSVLLLKMVPEVFSRFCELWRFPVFSWYFALPSTSPDAAQRWMVPSTLACCWSVSLNRRSRLPLICLHLANDLHAAISSRDACPYNTIPTATSHQLLQSYYLLASVESHQQQRSTEKMNLAVLNQPKMQRKISLPLQREREREWGREWAKPESSGALPIPLEACDRSLFYPSTREIGSMCLIHSWTVSDSNSYLGRDAVKHIRIEWFVLHRHTCTHYLQHLHFRCIKIPAAL